MALVERFFSEYSLCAREFLAPYQIRAGLKPAPTGAGLKRFLPA
jgi:hypothetical protein